MRIRTIKPEFFKHEAIADLPPLVRLLFVGLWCMADRRGRLEDRPRRIKVECLPFDEVDIDAMLWDLHRAGFVDRYEVEGVHIIQVTSFEKHQRISGKESFSESEFPGKHSGSTREAPEKQPGSQERKGKERKGKERSSDRDWGSNGEATGKQEEIYQAYPRKVAKQDALRAIGKALEKATAEELLEAVNAFAAAVAQWPDSDKQFIPYPATWFNDGRWEDDRSTWIKKTNRESGNTLNRRFDSAYYEEK